MNKKFLAIITIMLMCLAVQGYAQDRGRSQNNGRNGAKVEQRQRPTQNRSSVGRNQGYRPSSGSANRGKNDAPPQYRRDDRSSKAPQYRGEVRRHQSSPPRYHQPRPPYRYHGQYTHPRHHHHHCIFNDWYYYSWGGYHNRYIRHRAYKNRFFDSVLGYYLWGSLTAPTRLDLGNTSFTRYNGTLRVQIGNQYSYLDLYRSQNLSYQVGYTSITITTGGGYAQIYFYDEYGNQATYTL